MIMQSVLDTAKCWSVEPQATLVCWLKQNNYMEWHLEDVDKVVGLTKVCCGAQRVKKSANIQIKNYKADPEGRWIYVTLNHDNNEFAICNIYAPNKDTPSFFTKVIDVCLEGTDSFIIIGDYNLALNNDIDRRGARHSNDKSAELLNQAIEKLTLSDVWRERNPNIFHCTYSKRRPAYAASQIDFALTSSSLTQNVASTFYVLSIMTDHTAVFLAINFKQNQRGPGYWKFNNSHLNFIEFVQMMNEKLENCVRLNHQLDSTTLWEIMQKLVMC